MVDRIGHGSSLARAAIEAALKRQAEATRRMAELATNDVASGAASQGASRATGASPSDFAKKLTDGIREIDAAVKKSDALAEDVVTGRITDFHEVAAQLKESELSLKFALEVRNKFIDAYREVMRMSV